VRNHDGGSLVLSWGLEEGSELSVEQIALTMPADDAFQRVAHLVLGGLASRHDLTVETLEDLTLALDTLLERYGDAIDEVTGRMSFADDAIRMDVGPFVGADVGAEIELETAGALDVHRILAAVCDDVSVTEHDGGQWVELTRRARSTARRSA